MSSTDCPSSVLRDTLDIPEPEDSESENSLPEIPIDADKAVVKRLLDAVTLDKPLEFCRWNIASRAIAPRIFLDAMQRGSALYGSQSNIGIITVRLGTHSRHLPERINLWRQNWPLAEWP